MSRATKIWLAVATLLVLAGLVVFAGVMGGLGWNFRDLGTDRYETQRYAVTEAFDNISIRVDTADVRFVLTADGSAGVECYQDAKEKHIVSVEGDTLVIEVENQKAWYDYIGIHFGSPRVTVYLPQGAYASLVLEGSTGDVECAALAAGVLKITTDTGDISLENANIGTLELKTSTGEIEVSNVTCQGDIVVKVSTGEAELEALVCKNFTSTGSTGSISLEQVLVTEKLSVQRSTGDVHFERSDAGEIVVKTETGDVRGSLLSEKVFIAHSETGKVRVPRNTTGGRCEITSETGDILLELA